MRMVQKKIKIIVASALFIVKAAFPLSAQEQTLTANELFQISLTALEAGHLDIAETGLNALLEADEGNYTLLIHRTQVAIAQKKFAQATDFASRAFWAAKEPSHRFRAARLSAFAHGSQENDVRAQIWLRIARQYAANTQEEESVAQDYNFVRSRTPWSTSLSFSAAPSSNVNNGSSSSTLDVSGLPLVLSGDARALSGYEFFGSIGTSYRLRRGKTSETSLKFNSHVRTYQLTSAAQAQAPNRSGSDFSDASLSLGISHAFKWHEDRDPVNLNATLLKSWYGFSPFSTGLRLSASQVFSLSKTDYIFTDFSFNRTLFTEDQPSVSAYVLSSRWSHGFGNNNRFSLGVSFGKSDSLSVNSDYTQSSISTSYDFSKALFGVSLGFSASFEDRRFEGSTFTQGQRRDLIRNVSASARFNDIEFYGFSPVLQVSNNNRDSNVSLFRRDFKKLSLEWRSAF